jgi:hypothetical protein
MGSFDRAVYGCVGGKDPLKKMAGVNFVEIDGQQVRL